MNKWNALLGRITLFPSVEAGQKLPSALGLYSKIWGDDPENFQKPINPLMPSAAVGRKGKISVSCSVHPSRVDFNLSPMAEQGEQVPENTLQMIVDTDQLHDELNRIIGLIREGIGVDHVSRAALAVQFAMVVSTFSEANATLRKFMPTEYRPSLTDEEDFMMQVNKPKVFDEPEGLRINFLTKWSVERFQMHRFIIQNPQINMQSGIQQFMPKTEVAEIRVASIAFDHNNMPLIGELGTESVPLNSSAQFVVLSQGLIATEKMQRDLQLDVAGF